MKCPVSIFNFLIKNSSDSEVDIYIDGDIVDASTQAFYKEYFGDDTSTSFKSFRDKLNAVQAQTYNVYINSGGGLVTDAMAIHDLLIDIQNKGKTVNTIGRGIIASAATYILMAGKNCRMSKNSWFMIHNVSGVVWGDVNAVESYAGTLRKFNNRSRDFYAEATGQRKEDITKMMDAETWMTADETKEKGFVKEVEGESNFTNLIPREKWQFSNTAVLNAYNSAVKQPPAAENNSINQKFDEMKEFFQNLSQTIMNAIKGVKAPENNDHTTLMQSIGEAVGKVFQDAADKIDTAVVNSIDESVTKIDLTKDSSFKKSFDQMVASAVTASLNFTTDGPLKVAFDNAVKTGIESATNTLSTKLTDLETANNNLTQEITNLKGKQTTNSGGEDTKKPIGVWK